MPFKFLTYLQPTHYFRLVKNDGSSLFPIASALPSAILSQLNKDYKFKSEIAQAYDLSWQAIQLGYIGDAKTYTSFERLPLIDEYRFIHKYFNAFWAFYILMLRLLSLKNPITNMGSYLKTFGVERSDYLKRPIAYHHWKNCQPQLLKEMPLVSVIIPTLNRYPYLEDVLRDLEKQDYKNIEVIVIDQSQVFNKAFYEKFKLKLIVKYQEEKALWLARNTAIALSNGDYLLLFDDDSRVDTDWISNHLKCLDFFKADISSGVSISVLGAKVPQNYAFFRRSDQLDTGNVLLKKSIFKDIGLFDRQFEKQRMGDGEFGLRAQCNGFLNISNPFAKRLHLKVGSGGLREMDSWDAFRTKNWIDPRPVPSVLYFFRTYFGNCSAKLELLKTIPSSVLPYKFKGSKIYMILGALLFLFFLPIILFQVTKSWKFASKKLDEGPLIKNLNG